MSTDFFNLVAPKGVAMRSRMVMKVLAILLAFWLLGSADSRADTRYVAVIDAGSSGSRISLYERTTIHSLTQLRALFNDQGGLPIARFEASPADAGPLGVKPLIDKLTPVLAANNLRPQQVQVNLLATAGMRLVEDRNKPGADAIYASVRDTLIASGMSVGRVETLTGTYEGVYSWVDVNHLRGNFREPTQALEGIIEVGGASAQVAFSSANAAGPNAVSVSVNGKSYRLFSISWLGLGQSEARGAMIDSHPANGGGTTNNACYPENPSAAGNLTDFNADINGKRIISGQYNFTTCNALYAAVLQRFNVGSATGNADFASTRFVGVSSVYYALEDWGGLANPGLVDGNLKATCTGPNSWGAVAARLGGTSKFKQNSCANGTYIHSLLFGDQGLKVDPAKLTSVNKADGQSFSWTRGFALVGE